MRFYYEPDRLIYGELQRVFRAGGDVDHEAGTAIYAGDDHSASMLK